MLLDVEVSNAGRTSVEEGDEDERKVEWKSSRLLMSGFVLHYEALGPCRVSPMQMGGGVRFLADGIHAATSEPTTLPTEVLTTASFDLKAVPPVFRHLPYLPYLGCCTHVRFRCCRFHGAYLTLLTWVDRFVAADHM